MRISPTLPPIQLSGAAPAARTEKAHGPFWNLLQSVMADQNAADSLVAGSVAGGDITQVETLAAMRRAEMALQLLVRVRDQLVEGFNELRQMQL